LIRINAKSGGCKNTSTSTQRELDSDIYEISILQILEYYRKSLLSHDFKICMRSEKYLLKCDCRNLFCSSAYVYTLVSDPQTGSMPPLRKNLMARKLQRPFSLFVRNKRADFAQNPRFCKRLVGLSQARASAHILEFLPPCTPIRDGQLEGVWGC
jgi:hypothetical protein